MIHTLIRFIRNHFYPLLLFLITLTICIANYTPGTWLTGWDTLHPEFNLPLNFERIINGVWREEQGLGAVAVHSHMSELPRYIFLWITSLIFPTNILRYLYIFFCFIAGPIGVYFFLRHVLRKKDHEGEHSHKNTTESAAFVGSLAYIFNIAVLHQFSVPFEMFPTQYAFMPWLFLFVTRFVETGKRKYLLYFAIVTFLATPMAYAAQLWYAYFGGLILYLIFMVVRQKYRVQIKTKLILFPLVITLAVNSFWLLPHLYQLADTSSWIPRGHINELFSERMFAYNKARGTIFDVSLLRGSLYDWTKYNGEKFVPLFDEWGNHMNTPQFLTLGHTIFGLVLLGLILSFVHKNKYGISFFPVGLLAAAALMNMNPPFNIVFGPLRDHLPLFQEALRSPYTKFSLLLLFAYSFYVSYVVKLLFEYKPKISTILTGVFAALLILYMFPFFQGKLIDPEMRNKIPKEYFETFEFFNKQPKNERIATVAYQSFWGWDYYNFGYQGAGFLWFGLPQPLLVRDFDRWNPNNENFYWEIAHAAYSENYVQFEQVLTKYRVSWLIIDKNIVSPDAPKTLYYENIKKLFDQSQIIREVKTFGNISIYHIDIARTTDTFTYIDNLSTISPRYNWNDDDQAYIDSGDYFVNDKDATIYPFRTLFSGKNQEELEYTLTETPSSYIIKPKTPTVSKFLSAYTLSVPENSDEIVELSENSSEGVVSYPAIMADRQLLTQNGNYSFTSLPSIEVTIPKIAGQYTFDSSRDINLRSLAEQRCDRFSTGELSRFMENRFLRLTSNDASNCLDLTLPNLPHHYSYLIRVETTNNSGSSLLFSLINKTSGKTEIQTYLPSYKTPSYSTFILPDIDPYGVGYALHFDNMSIGHEKTSNDIGKITVQPFPYDFVQKIKLIPEIQSKVNTIVYAENYDPGWIAYETPNELSRLIPIFFGKPIKEHVLVNNWSNGWVLPTRNSGFEPRNSITIVFWPQYLEYIGFALLLLTLLILLRNKNEEIR